jgi:hypothetical protein
LQADHRSLRYWRQIKSVYGIVRACRKPSDFSEVYCAYSSLSPTRLDNFGRVIYTSNKRGGLSIMTDKELITKIRQARTQRELDQATEGYCEQSIAAHPGLRSNYYFQVSITRSQYFQALSAVGRVVEGARGDRYRDVIRVLQCAADRQFSLARFESPPPPVTARACSVI